jgi:hypothetical protein
MSQQVFCLVISSGAERSREISGTAFGMDYKIGGNVYG